LAAVLEARSRTPAHADLQTAASRRAARRALSALSADDQQRLLRWLALQVTASTPGLAALARVDPGLAARVQSMAHGLSALAGVVTSGTSAGQPRSPLSGLPATG
jgi:hypothetical protein